MKNHDSYEYVLLTVDQIIERLSRFTPEQRSLAWSPEPPFESQGGADCRLGGSAGLDFNLGTRRARWVQARYRYLKEEKQTGKTAMSIPERQENETRNPATGLDE